MKRILFFIVAVAACNDPVHDAEVAALGPEDPSVPQGPLHRPGQPCLLCHSDFSLAGTVYNEDLMTPYPGATVQLTDAVGSQHESTTNEAGNFYIRTSEWMPVFPIGSFVDEAGTSIFGVQVIGTINPMSPAQMITHIGRDGSCGSCHVGTSTTPQSPGRIYLTSGS
jgi:hypothetical protein